VTGREGGGWYRLVGEEEDFSSPDTLPDPQRDRQTARMVRRA
jgi:hypothetical protein